MVFSSFEFLLWFLPFCLIVYLLARKKAKNLVLLFFSIVFYAYGAKETPLYLWLILLSVVINWICGMLIGRKDGHKKLYLSLGLIWDFGNLFIFKYADFFIKNINVLPGVNLPLTHLILPLGISFFTFQIASYLIDVYRGDVKIEYNLIDLGTYILMFPQLIAGPIVRFSDVQKELHDRTVRRNEFNDGVQLFIIGLGRKVLLANTLGGLWTDLQTVGYDSISTRAAILGIIAYSMQLYFDFSGYSEMAIGLARMFNLRFPVNFDSPYQSLNIIDFWRRWHMTLGAWVRDYLYIPLGGNRQGELRKMFNLLLSMLLIGLWHGAGWTFVIWGGIHGVLLLINHEWRRLEIQLPKFLCWGMTFLAVTLAWVFFRAPDSNTALQIIYTMFDLNAFLLPDCDFTLAYQDLLASYGIYIKNSWLMADPHVGDHIVILLGLLILAVLCPNPVRFMETFKADKRWLAVAAALFLISLLHMSAYTEFLYFQF